MMNMDIRDMLTCSRKIMFFLVGRAYRMACGHPFVFGMIFLLFPLYILLPNVFNFLLSSSPIIICTLLILGTLLNFGNSNIPEIEDGEATNELSSFRVPSAANDLDKGRRFCIESHIKNKEIVKEVQGDHGCAVARGTNLFSASDEKEESTDEAVGICLFREWDTSAICIKKKTTDKREIDDKAEIEKAESLEACPWDAGQVGDRVTEGKVKSDNLNVDICDPRVQRGFGPSLNSTQKDGYGSDAPDSLSVSGHAVSNLLDSSLTDISVMPEKHLPLVNSTKQYLGTSMDNLHPLYDNLEKETKHKKETQKDTTNEPTDPVTHPGDDDNEDKNHMDLSASILERSKRLKSLILKRRARMSLRAQVERNCRGLVGNRSASIMDDLSNVHLQIPPISTVRQSHFELPLDSEDCIIPGSAPSLFLPRGNIFDEFDFSYDKEDEDSGLTEATLGHPGSLYLSTKDPCVRRYESFSLGTSFPAEVGQDKCYSRLQPGFTTGRLNLVDTGRSGFRTQKNDERFSKLASIPGSRSNSSVADPEYSEIMEQEFHQDVCSELLPCDAEHLGNQTGLSSGVYLTDISHCERDIDICDIHEIDFNTFKAVEEESVETFDEFVEYEMKVRQQMGLHSPTSDIVDSDSAELKYIEPSSTCSRGREEKKFGTTPEDRFTDF